MSVCVFVRGIRHLIHYQCVAAAHLGAAFHLGAAHPLYESFGNSTSPKVGLGVLLWLGWINTLTGVGQACVPVMFCQSTTHMAY